LLSRKLGIHSCLWTVILPIRIHWAKSKHKGK